MSKREILLKQIKQYAGNILDMVKEDKVSGKMVVALAELLDNMQKVIPNKMGEDYREYEIFFEKFSAFCKQCENEWFLNVNKDSLVSSLELFLDCIDKIIAVCLSEERKCCCCGHTVIYTPLSDYYTTMSSKYGSIHEVKSETLNKDAYTCPKCDASDRDRMIVSFLKKENLQGAREGNRVLQIAPATTIEWWIKQHCPQVNYESTDMFMDGVTFQSDIQNMSMVEAETYDVIICSHVLEHVQDDKKALQEMKRILKADGKLIFLVPVDLNATGIDEEWGLSEAENWRRFGQGDHCRKYSKEGLLDRLQEQFYVHSLGKEYFGEEIFKENGLTDTSTLYVLTKEENVPLKLEETVEINKELCENGPLVSVILPCYNHGKYVAEAIESVLNQSYKNIELLVADDASTDNTAAVMKQYSEYFAKEFYFEENAGGRDDFLMQYAQGKYIAMMHSDDIWEKDKLALQVAYMEKNLECNVCFTWCLYVDEETNEIGDSIFLKTNRSRYEWMEFFWQNGNCLCHPSLLMRTESYFRKPRYGRACRQLPDFFKWVDLVQFEPIHIMPKVLTRMRRYQNENFENTSAVTNNNIIRGLVEAGCNWLWIIRNMETDFFKKAFGKLMVRPEADTDIEIKCEKYFLMIHHQNLFVQNSGICYLHEIYNDVRECMESKYHYTSKDLAEDTINIGFASYVLK